MIKTAGANVSPLEVEAALSDATGGLAAMVLGVARSRARPGGRGGDPGRTRHRARPRRAAHRVCGRACRRTRCRVGSSCSRPADLPMLSSGKPDLGAIAELFDASSVIASPCPRWCGAGPTEQPDRAFVVTDDDTLTYGELERRSAALAGHFADLGVGKGTRVGVLMPNGTAWPVVAFGASRAGATIVPLSTFLRPPELAAQLRTAGVEHLVLLGEFLGRDYVADLMAISPELVAGAAPDGRRRFLGCARHGVGATPDAAAATGAEVSQSSWPRSTRRCGPPTTSRSCSPPAAAERPKGVIHTHGGALGRHRRRASRSAASRVTTGSTSRCRSSGSGGSAPGSSPLSSPAPPSSPRPAPSRRARCRSSTRERVTLFRGWPDQAAALARDPGFAAADLSSLRPGSLDAVMPVRAAGGTGAARGPARA